MKERIMLETLTDVHGFVNAVAGIPERIVLTDGNGMTVSAKSMLGALYTMEWDKVYCECERNIYHLIYQYVITE